MTTDIEKLVNQILALILSISNKFKIIKLFYGIPFALVGLISWNLSSVPVITYDESKTGKKKYIKIIEIKK